MWTASWARAQATLSTGALRVVLTDIRSHWASSQYTARDSQLHYVHKHDVLKAYLKGQTWIMPLHADPLCKSENHANYEFSR